MKIKIKRAYVIPAKSDGKRILIDRLWPRGLSKEKAQIDLWVKDIAPTTELRKWFAHDPKKWTEFQKRYTKEIKDNKEVLATLRKELVSGQATLIYSAKDEEHNDAVVLKAFLEK